MSDFKTVVPVDLSAVTKLLPPGSDLLSKPTFDPETGQVTLHWHHKDLVTPFTFELDYPVALLQEGKLPENTRQREQNTPSVNINVDKTPKKVRKGHLT